MAEGHRRVGNRPFGHYASPGREAPKPAVRLSYLERVKPTHCRPISTATPSRPLVLWQNPHADPPLAKEKLMAA